MKTKKRNRQLTLQSQGHGGIRQGAGRPRKNSGKVSHKKRRSLTAKTPAHVTVRLRPGSASLRSKAAYSLFRKAVMAAKVQGLRVLHFAVLGNHFHILVEANGNSELARGMQSLNIRVAKGLKKLAANRSAAKGVLNDRYDLQVLLTPTQVRHALSYVFANASRHFKRSQVFDWYCSFAVFDGPVRCVRNQSLNWWRPELSPRQKLWFSEMLSAATSWLARAGWLKARPP